MPATSLKQDNIIRGNYRSDHEQLKVRRRYHVDLSSHIACCEGNYARLIKLMGDWGRDGRWYFELNLKNTVDRNITIDISDRAKYTTSITIDQRSASPAYNLSLSVRLYHDASMAEVLAWSGHRQLEARYDYPNTKMYLADEKAQCNRFLSEWLDNSLRYGLSGQKFIPTGSSL